MQRETNTIGNDGIAANQESELSQLRQLCREQHEALQLFTGASMGGLSGKHALELIEKYTKVIGS